MREFSGKGKLGIITNNFIVNFKKLMKNFNVCMCISYIRRERERSILDIQKTTETILVNICVTHCIKS